MQYNKDNKAFEGGTHDNVTIQTLCDIMDGGLSAREESTQVEYRFTREASIKDVHKIFRFFAPSPMFAFGTDL